MKLVVKNLVDHIRQVVTFRVDFDWSTPMIDLSVTITFSVTNKGARTTDHKLGSSTYFFPALFICGIHKVPGPGPAKGLMLRATSCEK